MCELNRIKHLNDLNILYTPPEQRFDDITRLCTLVFKVPIALVSLVDTPVQWFKSAQGLGDVDRTPRNTSFCAWTLLPAYPEALVVEDAQKDARFKANPLVTGAPFIRFYAGCPLVCSNGLRLGSLCIIDDKPREFDANSCNLLANMAEMVLREIEKDQVLQEQRLKQQLQSEQRQLLRAIDCFTEAIMLVEVHADNEQPWSVLFANEAWEQLVGLQRPHYGARVPFWDIFQLPLTSRSPSENWVTQECTSAIQSQQNFELQLNISTNQPRLPGSGSPPLGAPLLQGQFRCAANTGLDNNMLPIGIPNFLPNEAAGARSFYFATLRQAAKPCGSLQLQPQSSDALESGSTSGNGVSGSGGNRQRRECAPRGAQFSLMATNHDPMPDIKLGPLLGKGAFGRVYRATWQSRMVAVKIIEYTQEPGQKDPLEGLLSEQVHHPNVVTTYKHSMRALAMASDVDDDHSQPLHGYHDNDRAPCSSDSHSIGHGRKQLMELWLLLEFCNRGCISDAVEKGWFRGQAGGGGSRGALQGGESSVESSFTGGLSSAAPDMGAILATAREVAAAMSYLHHNNMLHGDLTGNNVLLTAAPGEKRGYTAKVSDFGLSRLISNETPIIETRSYGTVTFMPAELLLEGRMSKAVDVYSWGVIVWEMYSGCRPFAGMSHSQVLHAIGMGRQLQLPEHMPKGLRDLLEACMARDPAKRPPFSEVLDRVVQLETELDSLTPEVQASS